MALSAACGGEGGDPLRSSGKGEVAAPRKPTSPGSLSLATRVGCESSSGAFAGALRALRNADGEGQFDPIALGCAPPAYSNTARGKYSDTTQFGRSTISLMRRSAHTLHSI